jgi:signal transduction histidine kinase
VLAVVAARVTTRLRESDERSRLQLERQNRDLESLARQKDRFFSNVSHELRTPLTLILAPIDRLIATHQDQASQDLLRAMSANARRLLRQVNALLDLSKADAGRLRLDLASGSIGALVERLTGAARPYAEQKGITLTLEGAEWAPTTTFDHDKIDIIIANLLSNALKFTPRGGSVSVAIRSTPDDVVVEVRDTGHGIPVEDHAKIFERFHQVDDSEVRAHEGTGLGLALALDLTNLHGGSLKLVESSPAGSLFRATIPRAPRDQGEERRRRVRRKDDKMALAHLEDQTAAQLERVSAIGTLFADLRTPAAAMMLPGVTPKQDIRVLLVEDNSDLRAFVAGQLAPYYHVTAVADGELGLASARAERPDVVITDAMMPKVDGVTLCRTLRADKSFDSTALIMLTARIGVDAVEQGLAAGADDYITKPFELRELLARVDAQVRARRMERSLLERDTRLVAIGTMTSGVVHDIRNGLSGVLAYADMARNKEGGGEFARELDAIVRLGMRLNRALQDILDFARGSDVSLRPSFAVPRTFGTEVGQSVRSSFEHAHISFEVQFDGEVDSIVSIDTDRMHRALENLLLNARDACLGRDERRVRLAIAVRDNKLTFVVDDSGSGIADDVAPRLFTTFATSGKRGGNGLGLATVRNIVRAHGGDIEAVPHGPLGGARFAMWLPVQPSS